MQTHLCLLLGVMPRSGTNYIANIITSHPQCVNNDPIYEDFLLSQSQLLTKYSQKLTRFWNPRWDKDNSTLNSHTVLKHIGIGLQSFLTSAHTDPKQTDQPVTVISKTPSSQHIENFFRLFPHNKLIIVMRDGRAVVESGMKSFDWDFEKAAFDWHQSTQRIKRFIGSHPAYKEQILLVRYEDFLQQTDQNLEQLFDFLGYHDDEVSAADVHNLAISGSSEVRQTAKEMSWKPIENTDSFKPLERFKHWSSFQQQRFNWIAGQSLHDMHYLDERPQFTLWQRLFQYSLDISWPLRVAPRTCLYLIKEKKLILKTY